MELNALFQFPFPRKYMLY